MASIGQIIDDKYEILTLIGQGGMSKVYLARDRRLNKQWAVKEIQKKARDKNNEVVIQSAIAEANMIKQLDHPSIVRIVDIIDNPDVIYIIEDYIEGETLNTILEENGAQPQELVIEWAMQICEALEYLHTRNPAIIYRDMKPSNVMLKPDGNIKIIDFGIAREYKEQSLADTVSLGTKGYAAPEQFGGKGQTDARTDVYGLGVTLYHLVTGHSPCDPPYEIYPIRHWNPQLDPGLEAVIEKCVQLNPSDRYQSCAELLYALQHYQENGAAYRAKQKKKLNSFITTVVMCVIFAIVGLLGIFMRIQTNNADYEQNMLQAKIASSTEEKLEYYSKASDIKPLELDPYFGMIEVIKEDFVFTTKEEQIFKNKLTSGRLLSLYDEPEYAKLSFEVGKLYWYYYDYGTENTDNNDPTRRSNAIKWFEDAIKYGSESDEFHVMSVVYRDIGESVNKINVNKNEGTENNEMYLAHWNVLAELVNMINASEDESEIVVLEAYKFVLNSIETDAKKFKKASVEEYDMQQKLDTIEQALDYITPTSEKTEELYTSALNDIRDTQIAIDNAYRK